MPAGPAYDAAMVGLQARQLAATTAMLALAACAPAQPAEQPAPPLRVVQRLAPVQGAAPVDPLALAATARQRWTADDIAREWTRLGSADSRLYMSPPLDPAAPLFAIVATFPEAESAEALLLWSAGGTLSAEDFARNRRGLHRTPETRALVLPADSLGAEDQPVRRLFVHLPAGARLAAALEALSVVTRRDLTARGAVGPVRLTEGGTLRDVVLAASGHRIVYGAGEAGSRVSFGLHLPHDGTAEVRAWQESSSGTREILAEQIAGRGWHEFVVAVTPAAGWRLAVSATTSAAGEAVAWSAPLVLAAADRVQPPHIVLYVVDALRADALGLYGAGGGRSPVLDALGREGVVFDHAYAAASWTKPSVTTLFTSLYPATHGVGARYYSDALPSSVTTLAEVLAAAGYMTAQFSANPFTGALSNLDQGFDVAETSGALSAGRRGPPPTAGALHDRAAEWLLRQPAAPAFAYLHAVDTHPPFAVAGATAREAYDASLAALDAAIGDFRRRLAAGGIGGNLLVVVTADHGEAFGEHGREGHGQSVYDEEVRVPLLLHWPGRLSPARIAEPVHHVDLAPTILALAGIAADGAGFTGRSWWPRSAGVPGSPVVVSRFAYPEDLDATVADRTEATALVEYPWKLVSWSDGGSAARAELYRLDTDPGERRDLAREDPARLRSLQRALDQFADAERRRHARFVAEHAVGRDGPAPPQRRDLLDRLRSLGYVR